MYNGCMKANLKACSRCYKFEIMGDHDILTNEVKSSKQELTCSGDWNKHYRHVLMATMRFEDGNKVILDFNDDFVIPSDCEYRLEQVVNQEK